MKMLNSLKLKSKNNNARNAKRNGSLKCFPFHKWENWKTVRTGILVDSFWSDEKTPVGKFIEQTKTCQTCGKIKIRQETIL
jgi:hypothetical protein